MANHRKSPDMKRGLSQVLYNYLPEKTFDLVGGKRIAQISQVKGETVRSLSDPVRIHREIMKYLSKWEDDFKRGFSNNSETYIYEKPRTVKYDIFPLVFRCLRCKRVYSYMDYENIKRYNPNLKCLKGLDCKGQPLKQIYHVAVHECGGITGLYPLQPENCHCQNWRDHISLDERKSQKVADFRWLCKNCNSEREVRYYCNQCNLPNREMSVSPHRAGKNYYTHSVRCVDVAESNYLNKWQDDVKKYLGTNNETGFSTNGIEDLLENMPEELRNELRKRAQGSSGYDVKAIDSEVGSTLHEYLETQNPNVMTSRNIEAKAEELGERNPDLRQLLLGNAEKFRELGIIDIVIIEDFPVVTAVFGYTRVSPLPLDPNGRETVINSFRLYGGEGGKIPVFTDNGRCEAMMFKVNPLEVVRWLEDNNFEVDLGERNEKSARYWLLKNMETFNQYDQLTGKTVTKFVYGLIHSLAHAVMKSLAGISGFELTGLSEYVFPHALAFVIYSNKTDFSIGGIHTLFETQLDLLIDKLVSGEIRICLYDPLCREKEGSCHACMYLPEISCWAFNKNLSRHYLYGGPEVKGYWEGKF